MQKNDNLVWESKCRRCGKVTEWFYAKRDQVNYMDFVTHITDKIASPRSECCDTCERNTVHDVISYSGPYNL